MSDTFINNHNITNLEPSHINVQQEDIIIAHHNCTMTRNVASYLQLTRLLCMSHHYYAMIWKVVSLIAPDESFYYITTPGTNNSGLCGHCITCCCILVLVLIIMQWSGKFHHILRNRCSQLQGSVYTSLLNCLELYLE